MDGIDFATIEQQIDEIEKVLEAIDLELIYLGALRMRPALRCT
jgi:hypothetical protein